MFTGPKKLMGTIEVLVSDTEWYSFGGVTPMNLRINKILEDQGGINESVEPGVYTYSVYISVRGLIGELTKVSD